MEAPGGERGSSQHRRALRLHGCPSSVPDQGASVLQGGRSCGCCCGGCASDETLERRIEGKRRGHCLRGG
eukprot:10662117-Prorocentrum_lima.AAC.1